MKKAKTVLFGLICTLAVLAQEKKINIHFDEKRALITNPLAKKGIKIKKTAGDIVITSTTDNKDVQISVSGSTKNGSIHIESEQPFNLVMNELSISNTDKPAIRIKCKEKVQITLADGTKNTLSTLSVNQTSTPKGVLSGSSELEFVGNGQLTILSSIPTEKGIYSKKGLTFKSGQLSINTKGSCIDGGNGQVQQLNGTIECVCLSDSTSALHSDSSLLLAGGSLTIQMGGTLSKGIKSKGSVYVSGSKISIIHEGKGGKGIVTDEDFVQTNGNIDITLSGDGDTCFTEKGEKDYYSTVGISCNGQLEVQDGSLTIHNSGTAGKGIKADLGITIGTETHCPSITIVTSGKSVPSSNFGPFMGDSIQMDMPEPPMEDFFMGDFGPPMDDFPAFDAPDSLNAGAPGPGGFGFPGNEGNTYLSTPKAIKSDGPIVVNNGNIVIQSNDDGIKSEVSVTFNNGITNITKSTEGVEAPIITVNGGTVNATASDDAFNGTRGNGSEESDGSLIEFNGGRTNLSSTRGDALDSNGNLRMTGGVVVIQGPASAPEVGIDVNGAFTFTGGLMVASGPSAMMMEPTSRDWSTQNLYCLLVTSPKGLGTNLFHLQDENGKESITFKPIRSAYNIYVISSQFKVNQMYQLFAGGQDSGSSENGIYTGGTYTGGTLMKTIQLTTSKFISTSI
jgi:trimeric autotransporter adhesin